jgi:hypothetical protein
VSRNPKAGKPWEDYNRASRILCELLTIDENDDPESLEAMLLAENLQINSFLGRTTLLHRFIVKGKKRCVCYLWQMNAIARADSPEDNVRPFEISAVNDLVKSLIDQVLASLHDGPLLPAMQTLVFEYWQSGKYPWFVE